jgi:hypothetical protein
VRLKKERRFGGGDHDGGRINENKINVKKRENKGIGAT